VLEQQRDPIAEGVRASERTRRIGFICARERASRIRLERACQRALDAGDGRYRTVRGILERGADLAEPDAMYPVILRPIGAFLRGPAAFARSLLEVR